MKMFLGGEWKEKDQRIEVKNPFDGGVLDTVPQADDADVESALAGAVEGARIMRAMSGFERGKILRRAAELMREREGDLGRTISLEEGKVLAEGQFEASRATETMELSAEEARRLTGEVLPVD